MHVIRATALKGYPDVMSELAVPIAPLLDRCGLDQARFGEENALLPIDAVCDLLEASSRAAACPDLGLRIARHQDLGMLGILGVAVQSASTPAEAARILSRFIFLQSTALRIQIDGSGTLVPNTITVSVDIVGVARNRQRQIIELLLGIGFRIGRLRAQGSRVRAVSLPHAIRGSADRHRRFFGVPVYENQPVGALHLDATDWNRRAPNDNPELGRVIETHLEKTFPAPAQRLTDRVISALRPLLGSPQANRFDIARILAIEPRTLHRRLRAEGNSFQSIKDDMRKEMALQYLTESDATLEQLTVMLGFPEQSSLSRACRKWFGVPPTVLRKSHRAPE